MMITLHALALLLLLISPAAAQSKCNLKIVDLPAIPELRGFRLGMPIEDVKVRVPKASISPADEFGFTALNIFPDYEPGIEKIPFDGVRSISLEFLDGRASSVWIGYDKTFKWQSVDDFTSGITTALRLTGAWRSKFRTRVLECANFSVAVIPVGESPSIKIVDEGARELLDQRKAAKEIAEP